MNTTILHRMASLIVAVLTLLVMSSANASLITINITGAVTDWDGGLGAQFSVGDVLTMQYSYDSEAVDTSPPSTSGTYALSDFSGTLGTYAFGFASGNITLYPDPTPYGDQIFVTGYLAGESVAGADLYLGSVWFRDYDGTAFGDDSLITEAPDLSIMESYGFFLRFNTSEEEVLIVRASIETATMTTSTIPEPAGIVLMALGLLSIGLVRRQRD